MNYTALHGSPGESFSKFDPERSGTSSGYEHAKNVASFTSSFYVAQDYAEGTGFVGRFRFSLENPLEVDDSLRPMGIGPLIRHARNLGHDGVILRNCRHTAISAAEESDIFIVFDLETPRLVETLQVPEDEDDYLNIDKPQGISP